MGNVKNLDSTAIYAYTTLISVLICVPGALIFEGAALREGVRKAAATHPDFYWKLTAVGLLYHLYNQVNNLSLKRPDLRVQATNLLFRCCLLARKSFRDWMRFWLWEVVITVLFVQFAFNTLSRISPVSHGVCNVVKRVAIIVTSVLFFGTPLSAKTKIGEYISADQRAAE